MRIHSRGVNDFVPAKWTLPQNPIAGIGDLVSGRHTLPQNPLMAGFGDLTPTGAMYEFPDNSVLSAAKINGLAAVGCAGMGCGCGGGCGMGASFMDSVNSTLSPIETKIASMFGVSATTAQYITYGGIALVAVLAFKSMGGRR